MFLKLYFLSFKLFFKMVFNEKRPRNLRKEIISLKEEISALRQLILKVSTGNKGVPTDSQQTDSQQTVGQQITDNQTADKQQMQQIGKIEVITPDTQNVGLISDLKKDLVRKFMALTTKEFLIFTDVYIIGEKQGAASYRDIAREAGLTESSIRDYIARLINKGIPIIKRKVNNKNIILNISPDLKSLFTLDSLINLREIQDRVSIQKDMTIEQTIKQSYSA